MQHKKQFEFLKGKFEAGQLGHAYLFSGQDDAQLKEVAMEFVKLINCLYYKTNGRHICSIYGKEELCQNCKVVDKEQFPDLLVIKSVNSKSSIDNEKDMMEIDVTQIRQANHFLSYKSYYGAYKAVIIENADRMNIEAQNSFLKTLEEPKGKTIIILLSARPDTLLPTIFSRCQTVTFFLREKYQESPTSQKLLQELLQIIPAELAVKFQYTKKANLEGNNANNILEVLQRYFRGALLAKWGIGSSQHPLNNYSIEKLKHIIPLIETLHWQLLKTNANAKLALEILLLEL